MFCDATLLVLKAEVGNAERSIENEGLQRLCLLAELSLLPPLIEQLLEASTLWDCRSFMGANTE